MINRKQNDPLQYQHGICNIGFYMPYLANILYILISRKWQSIGCDLEVTTCRLYTVIVGLEGIQVGHVYIVSD